MGLVKQKDVKNRTYCFYNDMINIKKLDSNLLKIDKKSYKDIGICNIGYITVKKIDDYEIILQMKIKSYLKNTMMFLMKLETKSKKISGDKCDSEKIT